MVGDLSSLLPSTAALCRLCPHEQVSDSSGQALPYGRLHLSLFPLHAYTLSHGIKFLFLTNGYTHMNILLVFPGVHLFPLSYHLSLPFSTPHFVPSSSSSLCVCVVWCDVMCVLFVWCVCVACVCVVCMYMHVCGAFVCVMCVDALCV